MPALIISAVDHTTDKLTSVAHGLLTGEGPATVRNIGGALPAGYTALDDVWIIRVDADNVKLASSSANALLGTALPISTNGTGTLLLEIGIPYRRDVTHVVGSQVRSATLNALEDSLKALHAFFTNQAQSVWSGIARGAQARKIPVTAGVFEGGQWLNPGTGSGIWESTASGDVLMVPIVVNEGEHITSVAFTVARDPSQTASCEILSQTGASIGVAASDDCPVATAGGSSVVVDINTMGVGSPLDLPVTDNTVTYFLRIVTATAPTGFGVRVGGLTVTTTVPAA